MSQFSADLTLDELKIALAPALADAAVFDGWSDTALISACELRDVDVDVARLAFSGGAMDMIAAWIASVDLAMFGACPPERLAPIKIRERIRTVVQARHTDVQSTLVVRSTAPIDDPAFSVAGIDLEDLVLAYMSEAANGRDRVLEKQR